MSENNPFSDSDRNVRTSPESEQIAGVLDGKDLAAPFQPASDPTGRLSMARATARIYQGSDPPTDEFHLLDYVRILHKHRWTASSVFIVVVAATTLYSVLATPIYQATARVLIESDDPKVVSFQDVLNQNQRANDYYQTQYKLLQSRAVARRALDDLQLWTNPRLGASRGTQWSIGAVAAAPVRVLGRLFKKDQNRQAAPTESAGQAGAINRLLSGLAVNPIVNSRLVDVTFRSPDATLAAAVANGVANAYIEQNLETRFNSSKDATDFLAGQLAQQRQKVESSQRALQQYREENDAVSLEDRQNIVVQKLADLNAAVTKARTERIQKQAAYDQIRAVQNNREALDTLPAVVSNAFIQQQKATLADLQRQRAQLSEKLGPRHPDMLKLNLAIQAAQSRIDGEISNVIQSLRNDYQQALAQEQSLAAALEQQKRDALDLNRKSIDYGVLARDATSNQQIYDSLMQRMKETGVSTELKTSNIHIVDRAEVPASPAFPRTRLNLLLSLVSGSLLGITLAFFFEYVDNRIKNPDEIRQYLGIPYLGMIPAISATHVDGGRRPGEQSLLINNGVPANFAESFRTLRTNLLFSSADEGSRSLIVTSTAPGEGKTVVASNIAAALALAGERVLLVDADMRKPRVHEVFGKSQKPGLSNILVGTARASESVHKTSIPTLWILPAGEYPPNPAELLGSKRCRELLGSLRAHFDWVVIDTPPIMAVTDAAVVGHSVSGVLFVVGSEMTARASAHRAVQQLEQSRARMVGAVLNRVDLQRNSYYYSQYYRRDYSDYYETSHSA